MNPVAGYDFRYNNKFTPEEIKSFLNGIAKHYVFQLERSDKGYEHYQGRLSLIKKRRQPEALKLFKEPPNYFQPTVNPEYFKGDAFYMTKEDTRIAGPWKDTDKDEYIPRQYKGLLDRLYPYQQKIWDTRQVFEPRKINLVYDPTGNNGKSSIASLCELYGDGIDVPPMNDMKEIIQLICDECMSKKLRNPSPIFIDLPRAMDKSRLFGIYTAIEQIKKGKLYDTRYNYKSWWIDSPQLWVFTNVMPDLAMLSKDRWVVYTINKQKEFEPYKPVLKDLAEDTEEPDDLGDVPIVPIEPEIKIKIKKKKKMNLILLE